MENTFIFNPVRSDFIGKCLETLYKYTHNDFRVIIVDQTANGCYDTVKDKTDLYLRPSRNLGFAKSMNEGIIHALRWKSPYITCANDDIEFINNDWWDGVTRTFEHFPKAAVVNPNSVIDRGEAEGRLPYKENYTDEEYQNLISTHRNPDFPWVMDGICMWLPVFPREKLLEIGLYDERFYPGGGEDYDWNGRAYIRGYRCLGTAASWVYHHWGKSKDEIGTVTGQGVKIDPERSWNHLDHLWPDGFDIYGKFKNRVPEIGVVDIR